MGSYFSMGDIYGSSMTTREESAPETIEQDALANTAESAPDPKSQTIPIWTWGVILMALFVLLNVK